MYFFNDQTTKQDKKVNYYTQLRKIIELKLKTEKRQRVLSDVFNIYKKKYKKMIIINKFNEKGKN